MIFIKKNKLLVVVILLLFNFTNAQNDTIFALDTIIPSVRIIEEKNEKVLFFYLDSINKRYSSIATKDIDRIVYENNKIEIFCDLVSTRKFLGTDEIITVNYGSRDSIWKNEKMFSIMPSDLKKYNSVIDALNYMGSEGWKEISSYSSSQNSYIVKHYILKKEIKK